jgi:hypothetical protein
VPVELACRDISGQQGVAGKLNSWSVIDRILFTEFSSRNLKGKQYKKAAEEAGDE